MHYDVTRRYPSDPRKVGESPLENAGGCPPPAGVEQGYGAAVPRGEVNRHAVRHAHGEQDPRGPGDVPVVPVEQDPPFPRPVVAPHPVSMDLSAENDRREVRLDGLAEASPPLQDAGGRLATAP
jgi:hypothetical protein